MLDSKGIFNALKKRYYVSHGMTLQLSRYGINKIVFTSAEAMVISLVSEVFTGKK